MNISNPALPKKHQALHNRLFRMQQAGQAHTVAFKHLLGQCRKLGITCKPLPIVKKPKGQSTRALRRQVSASANAETDRATLAAVDAVIGMTPELKACDKPVDKKMVEAILVNGFAETPAVSNAQA